MVKFDDFPDPPKKALCPFFLYRSDVYNQVKKENPDLRITDLTRLIGDMWKNVKPQIRDEYERLFQINKAKIARQKQLYEQKYGKAKRPRRRKRIKKQVEKLSRYFNQMKKSMV